MDSGMFEAHFMGRIINGTDILNNDNMVELGGSFYQYKIYDKAKALKGHSYKLNHFKDNIVFLKEVN